MTISFDITKKDMQLIARIAERADYMGLAPVEIRMDVAAVHANGCPLRLNDLLGASEFDFKHDLHGIRNHLNRDTGQLEDCFLPRYHA